MPIWLSGRRMEKPLKLQFFPFLPFSASLEKDRDLPSVRCVLIQIQPPGKSRGLASHWGWRTECTKKSPTSWFREARDIEKSQRQRWVFGDAFSWEETDD